MFSVERAVELLDSISASGDISDSDGNEELLEVIPEIHIPLTNGAPEVVLSPDNGDQISDIISDADYKDDSELEETNAADERADPTVHFDLNDLIESSEEEVELKKNEIQEDESIPVAEIVEVTATEELEPEDVETETQRSRKRKRDPDNWKQNIRKRKRQSGEKYVSTARKEVKAKEVKTKKDCNGTCRFKCARKINCNERKFIFQSFWGITDNEKNHFYARTIDRNNIKRRRTETDNSRKQMSLSYHFEINESKVRVCKDFYLSTLDISQKRIHHFFSKKYDSKTGLPDSGDNRGMHTISKITNEARESVRRHINSFPRVESHYCRSSTRRQHLEQDLSVSKMYRLYIDVCSADGIEPVRESYYREIFNRDFNISFNKPKKDACDKCEEFRMQEKFELLDEDLIASNTQHLAMKAQVKEERDRDRTSSKAIVCFDLENVLTLPRANVSSFYYRRKLSMYNLTAHCSLDKTGYCALWTEKVAGRGANEISSALIAILAAIVEKHKPEKLTLWSDSCVPQNRNSGMSFALLDFMKKESISSIEQKFCEPGHSNIQEVDNIHSHIEQSLKQKEIFSPIGVVKCIKTAMVKHPLHIIQLRNDHFSKYLECSKWFNFSQVPFTKVKHLVYSLNDLSSISYRSDFNAHVTHVQLEHRETQRRVSSLPTSPRSNDWPKLKKSTLTPKLSDEKCKDIKAMLKFMPPVDKDYMKNIVI